jgi:hypothetical protein
MALFSDASLEYGHGLGEERYRDCCTPQGTVEDAQLPEAIFFRLRGEDESSKQALLTIRSMKRYPAG